jgi:glycosyltransferase involved in cell wall biosynthesis
MYENYAGLLARIYQKCFDYFFLSVFRKNISLGIAKTFAAQRYLTKKKIAPSCVCPVGLNTDIFTNNERVDWKKTLSIPVTAKILLYIGCLEQRRNPEFIIRLACSLHDDNPNIHLIVAGNGPLQKRITALITRLGADGFIHLIGQIDQTKVTSLYYASDIFLLPSSYEIFGMVLLEAAFCGIPVISTMNAGAECVILDGETGYVIYGLDMKRWKRTVIGLLNNDSKRQKMSDKSVGRFESNFIWQKAARRYYDAYVSILHHPSIQPILNIVTANNFYYIRGGSERMLFQEQSLLRQHGHIVHGFSRKHPANVPCDYSHYFPAFVDYYALSGAAKIQWAFMLIKNKDTAERFTKFFKTVKPDIIHFHNIHGGLTTSVMDAAERANIPAVITLHDLKLVCPSYLMLNHGIVCEDCRGRKFYRCLINCCHKNSVTASALYTVESYYNKWFRKWEKTNCYICPSRFLRTKMIENGFPEQKLVHLPNFVNPPAIFPAYNAGDYLLYVGRLSQEKGIFTLVDAIKGLHIPLRIAGDGPIAHAVKAYVNASGMKNIFFEGYTSGQELAMLFQQSAFIVLPSECYENAPMTLLEAYSYGKPVLGARIGGIPEMIEEGKTGELFEPKNVTELREKILTLWESRETVITMGQQAWEISRTVYAPEAHYTRLMDIYTRTINEK